MWRDVQQIINLNKTEEVEFTAQHESWQLFVFLLVGGMGQKRPYLHITSVESMGEFAADDVLHKL